MLIVKHYFLLYIGIGDRQTVFLHPLLVAGKCSHCRAVLRFLILLLLRLLLLVCWQNLHWKCIVRFHVSLRKSFLHFHWFLLIRHSLRTESNPHIELKTNQKISNLYGLRKIRIYLHFSCLVLIGNIRINSGVSCRFRLFFSYLADNRKCLYLEKR